MRVVLVGVVLVGVFAGVCVLPGCVGMKELRRDINETSEEVVDAIATIRDRDDSW